MVLAWAYLLSARWTELIPGNCSIRYTLGQAPADHTKSPGEPKDDRPAVVVDIGDASPQEIRWWTAVLAPGRGWEATLVGGKQTFWSPWSIRVESGPRLIVPRGNDALPSTRVRSSPRLLAPRGNNAVPSTRALTNRTPSFAEAFSFLNNFCARHNIGDQSDAALAAALLLPTMGKTRKGLMLPAVVVSDQPPSPHFLAQVPLASHLPASWMPHLRRHLDKLMTLSCYSKGIRPMLLGAFYNPDIECNAVSPWRLTSMLMPLRSK